MNLLKLNMIKIKKIKKVKCLKCNGLDLLKGNII